MRFFPYCSVNHQMCFISADWCHFSREEWDKRVRAGREQSRLFFLLKKSPSMALSTSERAWRAVQSPLVPRGEWNHAGQFPGSSAARHQSRAARPAPRCPVPTLSWLRVALVDGHSINPTAGSIISSCLLGCVRGGPGRQELPRRFVQTVARRQSNQHLSLQSVVEDCSVLSAKVASCAGCVKQHFFFSFFLFFSFLQNM